nr:ATPase subunit 6 [Brachionus falcatus]
MLIVLNKLLLSFLLLSFAFFNLFKMLTLYSILKHSFMYKLFSLCKAKVVTILVVLLCIVFFLINLSGHIPLNSNPTLFYSQTLTISFMFWLPNMSRVSITQLNYIMPHMLPYASPVSLMLTLPLKQIFSQLIRPFTETIRMKTNLSTGHIMMYMFIYFTLLSSSLSPFIYLVLGALFILELCIFMVQAYTFVLLISLYINETV